MYKIVNKIFWTLFLLFLSIEGLLIFLILTDPDRIFSFTFDFKNGWDVFFNVFDTPILIAKIYAIIWTITFGFKLYYKPSKESLPSIFENALKFTSPL